jgi:1-deoxy-D-xylulose-5-phosphate synthase
MSSAADGYFLPNSLELPADLRALEVANLAALATEVRALLSHNVATPPEQLAAALAAVELAIAVHHVFDTCVDRIVWDSGPQFWAHRVLTGPRERPVSAAYPRALQSFRQGACAEDRPGSAIGAALGMAVAAARQAEERQVVAVVAAEALTAGMAFEALNHAGALPADMLVILNDGDPARAGTSSALSNQLAMVLSGQVYTQLRDGGKKVLRQMPTVRELARRSEQHLKGMVLPGTIFEELGFNYIGPVDGHNIGALVVTLRNLKRLRGPQFLHVLTGGGATAAAAAGRTTDLEAAPAGGARNYDQVLGRWLCEVAESDPMIIAIATALRETSGLHEFARRFPQRCIDASIAQQHAVTFAAGLAAAGRRPVVAISSTSLQRAYDQVIHDVALQRLPVMFAVHHAGLVGGDLRFQHGAYDLSYLRCVPHLTIMTPADESECRQMFASARTLPGPAVVRYPCGEAPGVAPAAVAARTAGGAEVCREGASGVALLVFGTLLEAAAGAAERLDATLVNMRFVKPLDEDLLARLCARHRALVTIEDNVVLGGAGTGVAELLAARGLRIPLLQLGIPERFIQQGTRRDCLAAARLDAPGLAGSIRSWLSRDLAGSRA